MNINTWTGAHHSHIVLSCHYKAGSTSWTLAFEQNYAPEEMAGQGAGPSRRSHTKSRKGCKTCKRRHIRCDETFPQWCVRLRGKWPAARLTGKQPQLYEASSPLRLHGEYGLRYPKPGRESRTTPNHFHTRRGKSCRALATDRQLSISRSKRLSSSFDTRLLQDRPSIDTSPVIHLERPPPEQLKRPYIMDTQIAKVSRANPGACGVQPRIP